MAADLTVDDTRADPRVVAAYAEVGLLAALDRLLAQSGSECVFETGGISYLSVLVSDSTRHTISLSPLLHFIRRGLDPTLISSKSHLSALQLAREQMQSHPLPPPRADALQSLTDSLERLDEGGWLPNLATERVAQQTAATWVEENQRRAVLHTRFMHALVSAWRVHSSKVRVAPRVRTGAAHS
jgi:hypothetical protein